jgi:hypothetical protein
LRLRVMSVLWPLSDEKRKWLGHRQTDAIDPTETWTAEIFQRKLTVEPPSGSCKYLL